VDPTALGVISLRKSVLAAALTAAALFTAGSAAASTTIDFNEFTSTSNQTFAQVTSQGYLFTNSFGEPNKLLVWRADELANADFGHATLSNNYSDTTTTVRRVDNGLFDLVSIDLADIFNRASGGDVLFTFNRASGAQTQTVSLDQAIGLETFAFNQGGLTSFSYKPLTTTGPWIQADNVVVDAAAGVPEPATWALMIIGVGGVGSLMRSRRRLAVAA
jgi:hypothetical protein